MRSRMLIRRFNRMRADHAFEKAANKLNAFVHTVTLLPRHYAPKSLNCVTYVSGVKCYLSVG